MKHYRLTSALPAIAAAFALSSTPVLAQEVQPVPADPAPAVQPAPAPTTDSAPAATPDSSAAAQPDSSAADTATSTTKTSKHATRRTVPKAAAPVTHTAMRTTTARSATVAPRTVAPAAAPAPVAPTPAAAPVQQSQRPKPIIDLSAKPPAATPAVAHKPAKKKDPTLPIAGGALAFLAIGGAAAAMTRRRHDNEEEWTGEEMTAEPVDEIPMDEPIVHEAQPAIVAPTAFDWNGAPAQTEERADGQTYVERAYRGPTLDNPSLSLKKRLKRAAFLDKREAEVAAGRAVPVDPTAGLPGRLVEQQQTELDRA